MFPCHVNMRHAMSRWSCRRNSPLNYHLTMSTKGRSASPPSRDVDVDMERQPDEKPDPKVIVITNLTRNVVEPHLQSIFSFYGEVIKIDLPTYVKCVLLHMLGFLSFSSYFSPFSKKQLLSLFSRSRSKQRKSLARIRRHVLRPNGRVPHERRPARRRSAQSRALRRAPPHALALSSPPLPPAKRP